MPYYVFVDNSNVWIEGKVASAVAKGYAANTVDAHKNGIEDPSWRIDFGKLLCCVTDGNTADKKRAVLFGSKPPHNDSLWNAMKSAQFEVNALDRNTAGKEKAVDTGIVCEITKSLYTESADGDVFILVLGDKDFLPALESIRAYKRKSLVAFWDNASGELISGADKYIDLTQRLQEITH